MADDIDRANDLAEMERNQAIRDALRAKGPVYCGRCYNCDEPLEEGIFCPGGECAEDYQRRNRRRA